MEAVIRQSREHLDPRKPGEAGRTLSGSLQRARPSDTLISDFWPENWEINYFCCFKPPSLWSFVPAAPGHSYI